MDEKLWSGDKPTGVRRPSREEKPDSYYIEQSQKAIDRAIEYAAGRSLEEIKFAIRRDYPFGPKREGRQYKIWNQMVLDKEVELGLENKKHKSKPPSEFELTAFAQIDKVLEATKGKSIEEIDWNLKRACPFKDKKSKEFRKWHAIALTRKTEFMGGSQ